MSPAYHLYALSDRHFGWEVDISEGDGQLREIEISREIELFGKRCLLVRRKSMTEQGCERG